MAKVCATGRCGKPATHVVKNYFFVAAKGHRDMPVCAECGARHAAWPNRFEVKPLAKTRAARHR